MHRGDARFQPEGPPYSKEPTTDKAVDDFTRVVEQTGILKGPSAFDVAMNETRRDDVESWARLERGLKDDGL